MNWIDLALLILMTINAAIGGALIMYLALTRADVRLPTSEDSDTVTVDSDTGGLV